jgi:excisionase family DNA binding protein
MIDTSLEYGKREAAAATGVNERTIHRAIQAGQLPARKVPLPGGGEKVLITGETLKAWLDTRATPTLSPAVTRQADSAAPDSRAGVTPETVRAIAAVFFEQFGPRLLPASSDNATPDSKATVTVPIESKPLLTLDEARALTGLSRNHLLEAFHAKKLKARVIGRAWRIKRSDLDAYLKKL